MDALTRLIPDPLFVLDAQGRLLERNRQGAVLLAKEAGEAAAAPFEPDEAFRKLVESASGTSDPVPGALRLRVGNELKRTRVRAIALDRSSAATFRIAVQVLDSRQDEFSLLSRRIRDLNREIAQRQSIQARLEESLARNSVLYRELQHRVKNHLQMMLGLFSTAKREVQGEAEAAFLAKLEATLRVIFEAQQLMYEEGQDTGVSAEQLLASTTAVVAALVGEGVQIEISAAPVRISNDVAFPLALIVNELVSNAVKYGSPNGAGRIRVNLLRVNGELELSVADNGPGFAPQAGGRRSSGLGLVRGLCRQIGGRLDVINQGGAVAKVRFPGGT